MSHFVGSSRAPATRCVLLGGTAASVATEPSRMSSCMSTRMMCALLRADFPTIHRAGTNHSPILDLLSGRCSIAAGMLAFLRRVGLPLHVARAPRPCLSFTTMWRRVWG